MRSPHPVSSDTISCVLQAAQEIFCDAGYRASIDAVATRAGVARQTIYNNFNNKQNLFSKAIEHGMAGFLAELTPETGDMRSQLEDFARKLRTKILNPETARLHCMLTSEAPRFPEQALDFFEKGYMGLRKEAALILEGFMQQGLLRQDDPLEAAHFFVDALIGIDMDRLQFSGQVPDPTLEAERAKKHVDRFLRAYSPQDSSAQ